MRYTLAGSKLAYAPGAQRYVSVAWANDALGAVTTSTLAGSETPNACSDPGVSYCGVQLTGPLTFSAKP